jgi:hypothetical protein
VQTGMILYRVRKSSTSQETFDWYFLRKPPSPPLVGFALPKDDDGLSEGQRELDRIVGKIPDRSKEVLARLRDLFDEQKGDVKLFPYLAWVALSVSYFC